MLGKSDGNQEQTIRSNWQQDTGQRQTKKKNTTQKTKKMSNTNPTKNWGVKPGVREG